MTDKKFYGAMDRFKQLPAALRNGLAGFFGLCGIVLLLDLVLHKHGDYWWNFFGFHTLFGFVACVALVLVASWMRKPLMRDEQYYDHKSGSGLGSESGSGSGSGSESGSESKSKSGSGSEPESK